MFDTEPGGIIDADYPRTLVLPNGNVLWTFRDAQVRTPTPHWNGSRRCNLGHCT